MAPIRILLLLLVAAGPAAAAGSLRVGTSGDYAPFSRRVDGGYEGFDVAVARAFATERGLALEFVPFEWPDLLSDLEAGRFDVAMSGVTLRPERSLAGRFTVPVAETGAVALVRGASRARSLADLDGPGVRVAVNRGGHLEGVARARLPRARIETLSPNAAVREALLAGRADAAVSDTLEAPRWREGAPDLVVLGPFTRDRKAYLVRAGRADLAADLDAWLLAREADGSLARWRTEHLGPGQGPAAEPLGALLAALDERLALMPLVAEAKRAAGLPVEAPEQEARVVEAGLAAVRAAARAAGRPTPDEDAVRALYRAQIEAAREIQRGVLDEPPADAPPDAADLDKELRPALLRIGERVARLLVALPAGLDCARVRDAADDAIRAPHLDGAHVRALADAVAASAGAACPAPQASGAAGAARSELQASGGRAAGRSPAKAQ